MGYYVAQGKSVSNGKRCIAFEDDIELSKRGLSEKRLDALVDMGAVVKADEPPHAAQVKATAEADARKLAKKNDQRRAGRKGGDSDAPAAPAGDPAPKAKGGATRATPPKDD